MSDLSELRDLYQEVIIDHNKHPRNFGHCSCPTHQAEGYNPLCGDQLNLTLTLENSVITDIQFEGKGCAISTASASLMTEALKGKTEAKARELFEHIHEMLLKGATNEEMLGKLAVLSGVNEYPTRVKCASLPWHTLVSALDKASEAAKTE